MAPIKFEEHIKERLEERRIAPSAAGWERISGQLEMQQGKKKIKRVLWMSIAASFVIGVGLTALFFQGDTTSVTPVVNNTPEGINNPIHQEVGSDQSSTIKQEVIKSQEVLTQKQQAPALVINKPVKKAVPAKKEIVQPRTPANNPVVKKENYQEAIAVQNQYVPSVVLPESNKPSPNTPFINEKDEVATQATTTVVTATESTEVLLDQEVEALLRAAQREVTSSTALQESRVVVDANELLLDAEYEVDPDTFKDKVFRTIKQEIGKAIDAVANKDN